MHSLWLDRAQPTHDDPVPERLDDLVVGAGLTGLTTALLLARAGRRVAVVEARKVGAVTTGGTTAKVSLLQGTQLSRLLRLSSRPLAEAYVELNRAGQEWLLEFCEATGVETQRRLASTYAASPDQVTAVRREHDAAAALGLSVRWVDDLDVPFPTSGATTLADQAQVDPIEVLDALVTELESCGGSVHEGHRVVEVSWSVPPCATLEDGTEVVADNVVLATGTPILDRGAYFAKLEPKRSYLLAFRGATPPDGMHLSAGRSSRSLRGVPRPDGDLLLVGGAGHTVGRTRSELAHLDELRAWTAEHFPTAEETHAWSAQDYQTHDGLPHVGHLPRGRGHLWVATGYDKWGMTNAVAAAQAIAGRVVGSPPSWAGALDRRLPRPQGIAQVTGINLRVGAAAAQSFAASLTKGRVGPFCTHVGGTLRWNDAESTWDCPLHGSRFSADGQVLEGPAVHPVENCHEFRGGNR